MKKISIICIILSFTFIFLSCEKETSILTNDSGNNQENTLQQNNSKEAGFLYGGDIFYDGNNMGWIDPKLISDPLIYKNIKYGELNKYGYSWKDKDVTIICCPNTGTNCGDLIYVEPGKPDRVVGLYLANNY
jgi:hypothetical protein